MVKTATRPVGPAVTKIVWVQRDLTADDVILSVKPLKTDTDNDFNNDFIVDASVIDNIPVQTFKRLTGISVRMGQQISVKIITRVVNN